MNHLNISSVQTSFQSFKNEFILIGTLWLRRIVVQIKTSLPYLEDRRVASTAIFLVNFGIIELAIRIGELVGYCFPTDTKIKGNIKKSIEVTLTIGLTALGNCIFVKKTGISLNPLFITAIAIGSYMVRCKIADYLEP